MTTAIGTRIHLASPGSSQGGDTEIGSRVEIGTVGATLASVRVDGVQITQPIGIDERVLFCNGVSLVPWPNRVRDGIWNLDGVQQQLDLTEPERHNALHGLLQFVDFEVRDQTDAAVTLGAFVAPQHGWPLPLDAWIRFEAVPDGVAVTHGVTNLGPRRAPYATGAHPYLRVGDVPIAELRVTLAAETYFDVDDRLDPIAELPVEGTRFDLRGGALVGDLDLDTAYGRLVRDGRESVTLTAPDGATVTLLQDEDWRYSQVFTTEIFPIAKLAGGTPQLIPAIAIEPMTAPPDALNSGEGLIWLEPGETWQGSWGLRYTATP